MAIEQIAKNLGIDTKIKKKEGGRGGGGNLYKYQRQMRYKISRERFSRSGSLSVVTTPHLDSFDNILRARKRTLGVDTHSQAVKIGTFH